MLGFSWGELSLWVLSDGRSKYELCSGVVGGFCLGGRDLMGYALRVIGWWGVYLSFGSKF